MFVYLKSTTFTLYGVLRNRTEKQYQKIFLYTEPNPPFTSLQIKDLDSQD